MWLPVGAISELMGHAQTARSGSLRISESQRVAKGASEAPRMLTGTPGADRTRPPPGPRGAEAALHRLQALRRGLLTCFSWGSEQQCKLFQWTVTTQNF